MRSKQSDNASEVAASARTCDDSPSGFSWKRSCLDFPRTARSVTATDPELGFILATLQALIPAILDGRRSSRARVGVCKNLIQQVSDFGLNLRVTGSQPIASRSAREVSEIEFFNRVETRNPVLIPLGTCSPEATLTFSKSRRSRTWAGSQHSFFSRISCDRRNFDGS